MVVVVMMQAEMGAKPETGTSRWPLGPSTQTPLSLSLSLCQQQATEMPSGRVLYRSVKEEPAVLLVVQLLVLVQLDGG